MENNTLTLQIEPLDTLFFRDGKPFSMGDDSWADGIFPPAPSVIYGAIRSWILANNEELKNNVKEIIKDKEHYFNQIKIENIAYKIGASFYFPAPLDLAQNKNNIENEKEKEKDDGIYKLHALSSENKFNNVIHSEKVSEIFKFVNIKNKNDKEPENLDVVKNFPEGLINLTDFSDYMGNRKMQYHNIYSWKEQLKPEPKIGIGKNNETNSSDDGQLFRIEQIRPKIKDEEKFKIVVDIHLPMELSYLKNTNNNIIKIGGEGKIAALSLINNSLSEKIAPKYEMSEHFKIYLSTPAIFEKGWLPKFIDDNLMWINNEFNFEAKLSYTVLGKSENIGGWDMAENKPKSMLKAIPAGSVYFFKIKKGNLKDVYQYFKENNSISDFLTEQGFGIAYLTNF